MEFIQRPEDLKKNLKPVSSLAGNIKIGVGNRSRHFHRSISGVFTILRQLHLENSIRRSPTNDVCDILNFVLILTI